MSGIILLGTRKGTVMIDHEAAAWHPRLIAHAGIPVCVVAHDARDGKLSASPDHGRWAPKLSRSHPAAVNR